MHAHSRVQCCRHFSINRIAMSFEGNSTRDMPRPVSVGFSVICNAGEKECRYCQTHQSNQGKTSYGMLNPISISWQSWSHQHGEKLPMLLRLTTHVRFYFTLVLAGWVKVSERHTIPIEDDAGGNASECGSSLVCRLKRDIILIELSSVCCWLHWLSSTDGYVLLLLWWWTFCVCVCIIWLACTELLHTCCWGWQCQCNGISWQGDICQFYVITLYKRCRRISWSWSWST